MEIIRSENLFVLAFVSAKQALQFRDSQRSSHDDKVRQGDVLPTGQRHHITLDEKHFQILGRRMWKT